MSLQSHNICILAYKNLFCKRFCKFLFFLSSAGYVLCDFLPGGIYRYLYFTYTDFLVISMLHKICIIFCCAFDHSCILQFTGYCTGVVSSYDINLYRSLWQSIPCVSFRTALRLLCLICFFFCLNGLCLSLCNAFCFRYCFCFLC